MWVPSWGRAGRGSLAGGRVVLHGVEGFRSPDADCACKPSVLEPEVT